MHSPFFPIFPLPHQTDILTDLNVRILTPIRSGYFGIPLSAKSAEEGLEQNIEDVDDFILSYNLAAAPIISQASGAIFALKHAGRVGGEKRRIIIASPQYHPTESGDFSARHEQGMSALARRSPHLLGTALKLILRRLAGFEMLFNIFEKLYSKSPPDIALLKQSRVQSWAQDILVRQAIENLDGIIRDLVLAKEDWTQNLDQLSGNISIIYGEQDPYAYYDLTREKIENAGLQVEIIKGFGQNSTVFKPDTLLRRAFPSAS